MLVAVSQRLNSLGPPSLALLASLRDTVQQQGLRSRRGQYLAPQKAEPRREAMTTLA